MPFKDRTPKLELLQDGWPLKLAEDVEYRPGDISLPMLIRVPVGFITDLASVPRIFWRIFPPFGRYSLAAIVHDYLYAEQPHEVTRKMADRIFLVAMKELGVGLFTASIIYRAVRLGGGKAWKRYKAEKEAR